MDLVRGMIATDKRMQEEHIAFILREVIKVNLVATCVQILYTILKQMLIYYITKIFDQSKKIQINI